jgi:replicative DNA helicase
MSDDNMPELNTMPHNREAEEAVLGSVLISPEAYFEVAEHIKADDFYVVRNQWIWEAVSQMHEKRIPIDFVTISEQLESAGQLTEIGGPAYLTKLISDTPTSLHAEAYAKLIKATATRRRLLNAANQIARLAYNTETSVEDAVTGCIASVVEIAGDATSGQIKTAKQVFSEVYDQVDQLSQQPQDQFPGVPTGIYDLDRLMGGGMQKSRLYVLGGRPGQGKTSLLLTILHYAAYEKRKKVAVFSLEMDNNELGQRMASMDSSIEGQAIQTGKLQDGDWEKFTHSIEGLSEAPILFDDTAYLSPAQLRAKSKRIQAQYGLDLVILDYLGLLTPDRQYKSRVDEVSEVSRCLKQLSRELKVPILAAHQLNRAVEQRAEKKPQLSDLRDSGSVEQDADVVWLISQDERNTHIVHLEVAKHRNGPTGNVDMLFQKSTTQFVSLARGV